MRAQRGASLTRLGERIGAENAGDAAQALAAKALRVLSKGRAAGFQYTPLWTNRVDLPNSNGRRLCGEIVRLRVIICA